VHRELRGAGVSKLGQRQKLSALVAPHWEALSLKERGNEAYRESRFEAAAEAYSRALAVLPCAYTDLALACYSNRAACRQQSCRGIRALERMLESAAFSCVRSHCMPGSKYIAQHRIHTLTLAYSHRGQQVREPEASRCEETPLTARGVNRQQMREPEAALADTLHVLRYDPANPKAVARRRVYEQALQGA